MTPGETMAREALATWEKAASAYSESVVRDPRVLELGSNMLKLGLQWKKTMDQLLALSIPGAFPGFGGKP